MCRYNINTHRGEGNEGEGTGDGDFVPKTLITMASRWARGMAGSATGCPNTPIRTNTLPPTVNLQHTKSQHLGCVHIQTVYGAKGIEQC